MFEFHVHGFGMAAVHGHADRGGRNAHIVIVKDLLGLVHHLHFFLGIQVVQEDVNLRDQVKGDGIMLLQAGRRQDVGNHLPAFRVGFRLVRQLVDAFLAGAADCLVGGNHDAFDAGQVIQRLQGHAHDDGGTVGVGDDAFMFQDRLGIDLGNDQRHFRIHTEGAGVIDDNCAGFHGDGGKILGDAAACEEGDVDAVKGIFFGFLHYIFFTAYRKFGPRAAGRCQKTQFRKGEIAFLNQFQKLRAYRAGSA